MDRLTDLLDCNIYETRHPFSIMIRDLMQKRNLVSTYDSIPNFDPLSSWTRKGKSGNGVVSHTLMIVILLQMERALQGFIKN